MRERLPDWHAGLWVAQRPHSYAFACIARVDLLWWLGWWTERVLLLGHPSMCYPERMPSGSMHISTKNSLLLPLSTYISVHSWGLCFLRPSHTTTLSSRFSHLDCLCSVACAWHILHIIYLYVSVWKWKGYGRLPQLCIQPLLMRLADITRPM